MTRFYLCFCNKPAGECRCGLTTVPVGTCTGVYNYVQAAQLCEASGEEQRRRTIRPLAGYWDKEREVFVGSISAKDLAAVGLTLDLSATPDPRYGPALRREEARPLASAAVSEYRARPYGEKLEVVCDDMSEPP